MILEYIEKWRSVKTMVRSQRTNGSDNEVERHCRVLPRRVCAGMTVDKAHVGSLVTDDRSTSYVCNDRSLIEDAGRSYCGPRVIAGSSVKLRYYNGS